MMKVALEMQPKTMKSKLFAQKNEDTKKTNNKKYANTVCVMDQSY